MDHSSAAFIAYILNIIYISTPCIQHVRFIISIQGNIPFVILLILIHVMIKIQIIHILRASHNWKKFRIGFFVLYSWIHAKFLQSLIGITLSLHCLHIGKCFHLFYNLFQCLFISIIGTSCTGRNCIILCHIIICHNLRCIIYKYYRQTIFRPLKQLFGSLIRKLVLHKNYRLISGSIRIQKSIRAGHILICEQIWRKVIVGISCILKLHITPVISVLIMRLIRINAILHKCHQSTWSKLIIVCIICSKDCKIHLRNALLKSFLDSGKVGIQLRIVL